ncbi:MAG: FAD-binding oxidoreductase, partial [Thermoplasmata archaeon]|nr:FAD-binding oxidoreductase [Thermoplasmata archaeon]
MTVDIEKLYGNLTAIVGKRRVKVDKVERLLYSHDLAPLPKEAGLAFKLVPDAVVLPKSASEVSNIIKLACAEHIPIVPRGA